MERPRGRGTAGGETVRGYSGWGPGQVESELKAEAWVILKATSEIVFHSDPEKGWADALARKGPLYRIILQTGFKPSMN